MVSYNEYELEILYDKNFPKDKLINYIGTGKVHLTNVSEELYTDLEVKYINKLLQYSKVIRNKIDVNKVLQKNTSYMINEDLTFPFISEETITLFFENLSYFQFSQIFQYNTVISEEFYFKHLKLFLDSLDSNRTMRNVDLPMSEEFILTFYRFISPRKLLTYHIPMDKIIQNIQNIPHLFDIMFSYPSSHGYSIQQVEDVFDSIKDNKQYWKDYKLCPEISYLFSKEYLLNNLKYFTNTLSRFWYKLDSEVLTDNRFKEVWKELDGKPSNREEDKESWLNSLDSISNLCISID